MRNWLLAALCCLLGGMLIGCWNYRDVEDYAIVAGCAVDTGETHRYRLTVELLDMTSEGSADPTFAPLLVQGEGETVPEAIGQIGQMVSRRLYWSNCQILLLGEETARAGIAPLLEDLNRSRELRGTMQVIVARQLPAGEILAQQGANTPVVSYDLQQLVRKEQRAAYSGPYRPLYELVNQLAQQERELALPSVTVEQNGERALVRTAGTAVFRQDRLVGFLTAGETRTWLRLSGGLQDDVFTVSSAAPDGRNTTLRLLQSHTVLEPRTRPESMRFLVSCRVTAQLDAPPMPAAEAPGWQQALEEQAAAAFKADIEALLRTLQGCGSDILGFGALLARQQPQRWARLKDHWPETFAAMQCQVTAEVSLRGSGMTRAQHLLA